MSQPVALFAGDVALDTTFVVDRVPSPDEKIHARRCLESPGGVVANAAVASALAGVRARLLIALGNDIAGQIVGEALRARSVEVCSTVMSGSTCKVVVLLEAHGEKRLVLDPGVSMYPTEAQMASVSLKSVRWAHTSIYGDAANSLLARCRKLRIPWSIDLEPATLSEGLDSLRPVLEGARTVFCNRRSLEHIGANAVDTLLSMGVEEVVCTLGAEGALLCTVSERLPVKGPSGIEVVDTTGAGDCLAGWYVAGRLKEKSPSDALETAVVAATLSCGGLGAQPSFPTEAMVLGAHKLQLS